ncbi:Uncharacterised protein [Bordetella pertussis]|nr:Uncharacterised protein [Bordetella pertussis]CRE21686.1 Uncharacterised protein [Bordetella pertussis]
MLVAKLMAPAPSSAGVSAGSSISTKRRHGRAPSVRAASSRLTSICCAAAEIMPMVRGSEKYR